MARSRVISNPATPVGRERSEQSISINNQQQPSFIRNLLGRFGRDRNNTIVTIGRRTTEGDRFGDIRADDLFPESIRTIHIQDLSVTTAKIQDLSVTTAKIQDLAVVDAKINDVSAGKITAGLISVERLNITGIILQNVSWTNNSPGAGSVAWSSGTLMYKGVSYAISSGNSANRYIYWAFGGTVFSSSATLPTLTDDDFMIALNASGTHDLYFNSPTPPVQGIDTNHVRDLAITDAKINNLTADKLTAGTISTGDITIQSTDGKMYMDGNLFAIDNGSDVRQVTIGKYDGTNYGLAVGSNPASPKISINASNLDIGASSVVRFRSGSDCTFNNSGNTLTSFITYVINQFVIQGDSTNGLNLYGGGGNISLGETSGSYGGGSKVIFIPNRSAAPTTDPSNGGILYAASGALVWRGSSGTVTTIAAA